MLGILTDALTLKWGLYGDRERPRLGRRVAREGTLLALECESKITVAYKRCKETPSLLGPLNPRLQMATNLRHKYSSKADCVDCTGDLPSDNKAIVGLIMSRGCSRSQSRIIKWYWIGCCFDTQKFYRSRVILNWLFLLMGDCIPSSNSIPKSVLFIFRKRNCSQGLTLIFMSVVNIHKVECETFGYMFRKYSH